MIVNYVGQKVEIIYLDKNNRFTQRKIKVLAIKEQNVKAFCLERRAPRIFVFERILAVWPMEVGCRGKEA